MKADFFKRGLKSLFDKKPLSKNIILVIIGFFYYKYIKIKYGKDSHILIMRGATGDIFLCQLYISAYLTERKICKYIYISDQKAVKKITELFGFQHVIKVDSILVAGLQRLKMLDNDRKDIHLLFLWHYSLHFNRCRIRMTKKFTFLDTYLYYVFGFRHIPRASIPKFAERVSSFDLNKIKKRKTIILSPEANSVHGLTPLFWNLLGRRLEALGFYVICSVSDSHAKQYHFSNFFFTYKESQAFLKYCGYFIALRSGLCDIVANAQCKKIILYPKMQKRINYSEHRSDIAFSSLNIMGLCNDAIEIESDLVKNITEKIPVYKHKNLLKRYRKLIFEIEGRLKEVM